MFIRSSTGNRIHRFYDYSSKISFTLTLTTIDFLPTLLLLSISFLPRCTYHSYFRVYLPVIYLPASSASDKTSLANSKFWFNIRYLCFRIIGTSISITYTCMKFLVLTLRVIFTFWKKKRKRKKKRVNLTIDDVYFRSIPSLGNFYELNLSVDSKYSYQILICRHNHY